MVGYGALVLGRRRLVEHGPCARPRMGAFRPWKTPGVGRAGEVIAEGTPRIVLFASLLVAVAAAVAGLVVGYFVRESWVLFTLAMVWLVCLLAFVIAAVVASRRSGVSACRVGFNAVRAAVWFAFNTLP